MQAKEAEAFAAKASGNADGAVAKMREAVAIEDSIDSISQPPYPIIPANELFGTLLMELNRPADAKERFLQALNRTPGASGPSTESLERRRQAATRRRPNNAIRNFWHSGRMPTLIALKSLSRRNFWRKYQHSRSKSATNQKIKFALGPF